MTGIRQIILGLLVFAGINFSPAAIAEDEDWGVEDNTQQEESMSGNSEEPNEGSSEKGSGGSFLNKLMEAAGDALGEKVDDELDRLSGNYKGKITDIVLVERLGNKLVIDARYEGIKRSDGVSIVKEVMYQGAVLSGFTSTPTPVRSKDGKVRLAIKLGGESEDDGWGVENEETSDETYSDQIRLSLVRNKKPEKQFGSLAFDIDKLWIDSDEPDQPFSDDEEIELEDDGQDGKIKPMPGVFVKPGVVIKPAPIRTANVKSTPKISQNDTKQRVPAKPVLTRQKPILGNVITIKGRYDIFANANRIKWSTGKGTVDKIAEGPKARGYIKKIAKGKLSTGNNASKMIYAHPAPSRNGFSMGVLPNVKLDKNTKFKSAVGFVGNSTKSDGVVFSVYLIDPTTKKRIGRKYRKRVNSNKYDYIDFDLSRYKGRTASIVMRIDGGDNSAYDSSVWIAPKLVVTE